MDREFLDLYNRELGLLYQNAKEFAEEFPGVAERLGGLATDRTDPMISGLLEGAAYLAARVQLKLQHEFPEFTANLLEQLAPHFLAPTPSALLAKVVPPYAEPKLKDGLSIAAGATLEARYKERDRRVACKFRLASEIVLWPLEISQAEFLPTPAALQALGLDGDAEIQSGLRLTLTRRSMAKAEDEPTDKQAAAKSELLLSKVRADELPVYLTCPEADAVRIYEKLFAHCRAIHIRYVDQFDSPIFIPMRVENLHQIGVEPEECLLPGDNRVFRGFDLVRDLFLLPQKFLGFRLTGLKDLLARIPARAADIVFSFDRPDARLASIVRSNAFSLYAAPAVNLFEMTTSRIPVRSNEHEYHVVVDRSRPLDFEPHRILKVFAFPAGGSDKTEVFPLYAPLPQQTLESNAIFYTIRRMGRRRTVEERRYGRVSNYTGTDVFLSLASGSGEVPAIAELSVRALCSNRHLTEHLPVGQGGADFILESNTALTIMCIAGPTPPRETPLSRARENRDAARRGTPAWRLISLMSFNHLGLTGRGSENSAAALQEILSLFADTADSATERRVRGILSIASRPIVRRIRQTGGSAAARGLEITVTFDEKAFEGSGAFLYGAVLDRFFAEYAPMNTFTQTVVRSLDRGELKRWPPRLGFRVTL